MALFKISKGLNANLPSNKIEGYCYYTTDDSLFYIDYKDENGILQRKALNAKDAETLSGASLAQILIDNELEIPSSASVFAALSGKLDTTGGTLTGNLTIDNNIPGIQFQSPENRDGERAYGRVYKNASSVEDHGLNIRDYSYGDESEDDYAALIVNNSLAMIEKVRLQVKNNNVSKNYNLYGEHNKPTPEALGAAASSHNHDDKYYTENEIDTKLDNKVDKVAGKGLSTNDYTTTEKNKLAGIATGANNYVLPSATDSVVGGMKLYTSTGTNTAGTMTQKAITDALASKSGTGHNHDSVYSKLGHTHTAADVGATTEAYVDNQIKDAKSYTDTKVAGLVDSAPETLNTLNELAAALGDDPNFATTMATELGKKATKDELTTHIQSDVHLASGERTKWDTHADSAHAPSSAERNIIVGIQKNGTDVSVDSNRKVNITVPTKTSELTNNSDFATNVSVTSAKNALQANIDTHTENKNNPHGVTAAQVGAAPITHEHNATDITDGILPVSRGGTGNNAGYVRVGQKAGTDIGTKATIEGTENTASGDYSHVEGSYSKAIGNSSHAEGKWTTSSGDWSHAEGNGTKTGGTSPASLGADAPASGLAAHAEGYGSVARAGYSHAEGNGTVADGVAAHSEGQSTKASGNYSHAEGLKTTASGVGSHAEGDLTEAIGGYSHAEGAGSVARGNYTHAEGYATTASGAYSHSEGYSTTAAGESSHVQGKYNIADSSGTYAHIVGNGTADDARSNAHTLDWEGNAWFAGNISSENSAPTVKLKNTDGGNTGYLLMGTGALVDAGVQLSSTEDTRLRIGRYSNGKPCLTIFHKVNGAGTYYDVYNKYSHPNIASTANVTTAQYKTMAANNELEETTLYMLTDDTEEEDLQATVNEMNNIDYEANLAFDVNEIV